MQLVTARAASIGSLPVRRVLPFRERRAVGPFVFLDEMGPVDFEPGGGIDVPPHPHIGLSTLTYMLEGGLHHRDSTGASQSIDPGAVNWMTAGHGCTHSERTEPEKRARARTVHGVQAWVALPPEKAGIDPSFEHHPEASLPFVEIGPLTLRILAGEAFGERAPVTVHSPLHYVDVEASGDQLLEVPMELGERAVYPLAGESRVGGSLLEPGTLVYAAPDEALEVELEAGARCLLLGGAPLPRPHFIHWNYVAWTEEEIEAAKRRWADGGFPETDESDFDG